MDDIELLNQTTRHSENTQDRAQDKNESVHTTIPEASLKRPFMDRLKSIIPPLPLLRPMLKGCLAILISLIFVFVDRLRDEFGQGIILVPIGTVLNFPFRPVGKERS